MPHYNDSLLIIVLRVCHPNFRSKYYLEKLNVNEIADKDTMVL